MHGEAQPLQQLTGPRAWQCTHDLIPVHSEPVMQASPFCSGEKQDSETHAHSGKQSWTLNTPVPDSMALCFSLWKKKWFIKEDLNGEIFDGFCLIFYFLFLDRGKGRENERETSMCGCLSCTPYWRPGLQPRHVPWLGIEPATLWFTGWLSIHWATPARADGFCLFICISL